MAVLSTVVFLLIHGKRRTGRVIAAVGAVAFLGFLLAPRGTGNPSGRQMHCSSNLHEVAVALLWYEREHGHFPPAYTVDKQGNRLHSWRTLILPYLDGGKLYNQIRLDEPWDSPHNSKLHSICVRIFDCPSIRSDLGETSYFAVVGPGTLWPGSSAVSLGDMKDAAEKTILVVEAKDVGIHWMEPRDLELKDFVLHVNPDTKPGISSRHHRWVQRGVFEYYGPGGANVVFADAHTEFLPNDTSAEELRAMLTIAAGD